MACAGLVALAVAGFDFAAGVGALFVDRAAHLLADASFQRHAMWLCAIGAGHAAEPAVDLLGQAFRHTAGFGFGPVEGHPETGAAGAAIEAGAGDHISGEIGFSVID